MTDMTTELAAAKAAIVELQERYDRLYGRYVDLRTAAFVWERRYWEALGVDIDGYVPLSGAPHGQ